MLRVLGARRAANVVCSAALHHAPRYPSPTTVSRCIWVGSSHVDRLSSLTVANNAHLRHTIPQHIQRRNYIFLPSSFSEASKLLKDLLGGNPQSHKQVMVKLQNRWQDTLFSFQERMQLLRKIQGEQRKLARQRAKAARKSMLKHSARYSLFVNNMQGRVGKLSLRARNSVMKRSARYSLLVNNMKGKMGRLSTIALARGKRNLLFSHYNAKKRIYARRKLARQTARKIYGLDRYAWGRKGEGPIGGKLSAKWRGITLTEPAQRSWFDEEGYPLTSRDPETGRFVNPWLSESTNGENGLRKFLRWKLGGAWSRFLEGVGISCGTMRSIDAGKDEGKRTSLDSEAADSSASQAITLAPSALEDATTSDAQSTQDRINLTWIGHSSTVVTFPGNFTVLTDPHFSSYAGPVRRSAPPAFGVADLPEVVDCVLISHDHMDHLDYWSILELIDSNKVKYWIVPLGIKSWLMDRAGVSPEDIIELEWWEGVRLSKSTGAKLHANEPETIVWPEVDGLVRAFDSQNDSDGRSRGLPDRNELVVTCAPAQHWCSRTPFDRNRRLWCSFAVRANPALSQPASRTHSFYFAGDTGMPPEFPLHRQIGDRLGPFDLSAIPIGAYEPGWFMRESHCNPAEAVAIHQALRSRRSVAVHFDTFDLADEPREEPPKLLRKEVERANRDIVAMAAEVAEGEGEPKGARQELIELLPPVVDFATIQQGESIASNASV
ncbi:hypothetical protein ACHAXT_012237 [Thalassiosira profunda]